MLNINGENKNKYSYVTLFDCGFLAVGIVMIDSFLRNNSLSRLYILCMDNETLEELTKRYKENDDNKQIMLISIDDFLTDEIRIIRNNRTRREFSWMCSALSIRYVLNEYKESICTYIDADLCFYANPDDLVNELVESGKSVQIIEHRFKMNREGRRQIRESGRFCVEFNTFVNDDDGNEVLDSWCKNVCNQCSEDSTLGLGDQFYLERWPDEYDCIHILENVGAGIAPWNINRYKLASYFINENEINANIIFDNKIKNKAYFYHFTHISQFPDGRININIFHRYFRISKKLVYLFYVPYLNSLINIKKALLQTNEVGKPKSTLIVSKQKIKFKNIFLRFLSKLRETINRNADFFKLSDLSDEYKKIVKVNPKQMDNKL